MLVKLMKLLLETLNVCSLLSLVKNFFPDAPGFIETSC